MNRLLTSLLVLLPATGFGRAASDGALQLVAFGLMAACVVAPASLNSQTQPASNSAPKQIDFEKQVGPILKDACFDCQGAAEQKADIHFNSLSPTAPANLQYYERNSFD